MRIGGGEGGFIAAMCQPRKRTVLRPFDDLFHTPPGRNYGGIARSHGTDYMGRCPAAAVQAGCGLRGGWGVAKW